MMRVLGALIVLVAAQPLAAAEVVRLTTEQRDRAGVMTSAVTEADFGSRMRAVGQVVRSPGSTLTLKTIASGRVESLQVAPGDAVRRGQVLAMMHSHELLTLESELLLAVDRVRFSELRLEAARELLALDGISRLELERREQEALTARLRASTLREELLDHGFPEARLEEVLESQRLDPHLPVVSPVDGVVLDLMVQEQEWVQAYAPLLAVGDPGRVELELQLAPDQASAVSAGDRVVFEPMGRSGTQGRATIITRVPQIDPATRTIRLRARIEAGTETCFPGAFVEATVYHGEVRRALSVPQSAVISIGGSDSVFVATGGDEFVVRAVELGQRDGESYEVVSGLGLGDEVASAGVFLLKSTLVKGEGGEN